VKGSPIATFAQVIGRNSLIFHIIYIPGLWNNPLTGILILVWTSIELVRYPFYALSLWNSCPYFVGAARYTVFIPTYPLGIMTELAIWRGVLQYTFVSGIWSIRMPNYLNFAFNWWILVAGWMCLMIFFFPSQFQYMLQQRKKFFSNQSEKKNVNYSPNCKEK